jgi:hypothetical protein
MKAPLVCVIFLAMAVASVSISSKFNEVFDDEALPKGMAEP